MQPVRVLIRYVDGSEARFDAGVWNSQRAEGVDYVVVTNASGSSTFSGSSAYWLYREGDMFVAGMSSFRYLVEQPPEVLFLADGTQDTRRIDYVPDLNHRWIKLGWWWPGVARPAT